MLAGAAPRCSDDVMLRYAGVVFLARVAGAAVVNCARESLTRVSNAVAD